MRDRNEPDKPVHEFGPFRFDAAQKLLFRGGEIVSLTPKAIDTLAVLIARRGKIVEKEELMKLVWPDSFVEEGGLARNISTLRKVLGEDEYIETIPKRGYRFAGVTNPPARKRPRWLVVAFAAVAAVGLAASAFWAAHRWEEMSASSRIRSIAVMPLKNLSNDPEQQYFSDGMSELLSANLAKTRTLHVVAAQSAKRVSVDAVVEGTVQRSGEKVRVIAQLIDVKTGHVLWADQYEREMSDVLSLQNEVAGAIVREVNGNLTSSERLQLARAQRVIPRAFEEYLKGRVDWNKRSEAGLRRAVEHFSRAIEKDPSYAPAYAGLADAYALLGSNWSDAMPPREAMPRAREAALQALKLDDSLAEARTSLAYITMSYDWDLPKAEKLFERAIELNPGYATARHWHAHCLLAAGKPDKALEEMRRARELDPESLPINVGVGWCYSFAGRYDEAIQSYRRAIEIDPGFPMAHQTLGMAYERKGMRAEALAEITKAVELSAGHPSTIASLGYAYGKAGERKLALEQLAKLRAMEKRRYVPALYYALVHAGLGDKAQAQAAIRRAREERSEYLIYAKVDPLFEGWR